MKEKTVYERIENIRNDMSITEAELKCLRMYVVIELGDGNYKIIKEKDNKLYESI